MTKIDVSIVMGIHREFPYVLTSLESIGRAVTEAQLRDVHVELLLVLDRSDSLTNDLVTGWQANQTFPITAITADNGNPGATRNQGIEVAKGKYVWTADADDLVSESSLVTFFERAESSQDSNCVYMFEYLVCFGQTNYITRYCDSDILVSSDFASTHPYTSRIFALRELLVENPYGVYGPGRSFSFEDWDLAVRLKSLGCNFRVVENTALYYRVRPHSVSAQVSSGYAELLPPSKFFSRHSYLSNLDRELTELSGDEAALQRRRRFASGNPRIDFLASESLMSDFIRQAEIEPELSLFNLQNADTGSWLKPYPSGLGIQLSNLLLATEGRTFSDIVVLPNFGRGGSQKYLSDVLTSLQESGMAKDILWIQVEISRTNWHEMIPKDSTFVSLTELAETSNFDELQASLCRFLLTPDFNGSRLHFLSCLMTYELLRKYSRSLSSTNSLILYRFVDDIIETPEAFLRDSTATRYLRMFGNNLHLIMSDSDFIRNIDAKTLGFTNKIHKFAPTPIDKPLTYKAPPEVTNRILWASRLASQKRPQILPLLQKSLRKRGIELEFSLYGTEEDGISRDLFRGVPGIRFLGSFDSFDDIPINDFDLMLYTSNIDGRPIVVLEALSAGLPVIGVNAGGMQEIFQEFAEEMLVPNEMPDDDTAEALSEKIALFYAHPNNFLTNASNISKTLHISHSRDANRTIVRAVMPAVRPSLLVSEPFQIDYFARFSQELPSKAIANKSHNFRARMVGMQKQFFYSLEAFAIRNKRNFLVRLLTSTFRKMYRIIALRLLE